MRVSARPRLGQAIAIVIVAVGIFSTGVVHAQQSQMSGCADASRPVFPRPRKPATYFSLASQTAPADSDTDLEIRLRELEQQFEEQRFQYESLQQQVLEAQQPATVAPVGPPPRYRVGSVLNMTGVWNNGLEFRTPNRDFYFTSAVVPRSIGWA
jgi:hypothetical protein